MMCFFSTYLYCKQNIGTGLVQLLCDCHRYEPKACTCTWTFLHNIDKNSVYLSNVLSTCACKVGDCCKSWNHTCHKQCSDFVCQLHGTLWCGFSVKSNKVKALQFQIWKGPLGIIKLTNLVILDLVLPQ